MAAREKELARASAEHEGRVARELEAAQKIREEAAQQLAATVESARAVFEQARSLRPRIEAAAKDSEEAAQAARDISTRAGEVALRLSECESRVREVESRETAAAVKARELADRDAALTIREVASNAAIAASNTLQAQLESAQAAEKTANDALRSLQQKQDDEAKARLELYRLGPQLESLMRRINRTLEAVGLEKISLGASNLNTAAHVVFALEGLPGRLEALPGTVASLVEAGGRNNALALITELLTTIRSRVPSFPLDQMELGPNPETEEAARRDVRPVAEALSARLLAVPASAAPDSDTEADEGGGGSPSVFSRVAPLDRSFEERLSSPGPDADLPDL